MKGVYVWEKSIEETKTVTQKKLGNIIQSENYILPLVKDEVRRVICRLDFSITHISYKWVCSLSECH